MKNVFKQVAITDIDPNPHRNFAVNPVIADGTAVALILQSYKDNGDLGSLPVRVSPEDPSRYQLAAGHNRLEALRQLGETEVTCKVADRDDYGMLRAMIDENATQAGGSLGSQIDTVAATVRQVAYWLSVTDNWELFCEISQNNIFATKMAYGKAKQCLTDNGEIGSPTITKAINSSVFKESRVKEKLGELHGTGAMATILQEVADRVAAERAELEAAQAAEIAAEKKRLADLEKQEQARIAADKKREEHIAKLQKEQAAAKKVAEKERIEKERLAEVARQRKSKQDAILVQREAKRLKDEAAKRKEEDEKRARQTAAAAVAREKIRESAYMHPDASTLLEASHMGKKTINKNLVDHEYKGGTYHVERFRTWVKKHPNIFPVASQPMFIADMRKELEGAQDYGGRAVETYMLDFIAQHDKGIRERAATQKKLEESRSAQKKADNTVAEFRASIGRTASAMSAIGLLLNDDKHVMETLMSIQHDVSFGKNLDHLDQMVTQLRKRIGVQTRKHNFKREIKEVSGEIV